MPDALLHGGDRQGALWEALKHTRRRDDVDFDGLLERAARQLPRASRQPIVSRPALGERITCQQAATGR